MNTVEQFINNNRDDFDSENMKDNWSKIEASIKQKKNKQSTRYWWAAAAAILIMVTGLLFLNKWNTKVMAPTAVKPVELPARELTNEIDPSYTYQMNQFAYQIKIRQTELTENKNQQPGLYKQFLKDNNRLDSSYNYLKEELNANPNKEILLDAMIQNLQLKLDLLNKQLHIIKQSKNKKANNESKTI